MRFIYIDEAGISNPEHEPFLTVAGVIVHADTQLVQVQRQLDKIVEKHIPTGRRDNFVFHAAQLFNGGGKLFDRHSSDWPIEKRLAIADDIAKIPNMFQLPLALGWVERAKFAETFAPEEPMSKHELVRDAHGVAFMRCALQVDHWMRSNTQDEVCMMIVEDNDVARQLIRELQNAFQNKNLAGLSEEEKKHLPLRSVVEDPLFQPKKPSSVLQLADFCAYVFKRILMKPADARYARFWEPMREQAHYFVAE